MKNPDLIYVKDDLFTRFYPETEAGRLAWDTMLETTGSYAVLNHHAPMVIAQLRRAGYRVHKAKRVTETTDELLAELGI